MNEVERIEEIEKEMPDLSMAELIRRHNLQDGSWENLLAIEEIQRRERDDA